jgi:hypothetical protein
MGRDATAGTFVRTISQRGHADAVLPLRASAAPGSTRRQILHCSCSTTCALYSSCLPPLPPISLVPCDPSLYVSCMSLEPEIPRSDRSPDWLDMVGALDLSWISYRWGHDGTPRTPRSGSAGLTAQNTVDHSSTITLARSLSGKVRIAFSSLLKKMCSMLINHENKKITQDP